MKKRDAIISAIILLGIFGYILYRQFWNEAPLPVRETDTVTKEEPLREINTVITYPVPGKEDTVRFTVTLRSDNTIEKVTSVDLNDPAHQVKLDAFSATLTTMIQGKKLEELEKVDRVGTSSLTTDAFNAGLEALKAQV